MLATDRQVTFLGTLLSERVYPTATFAVVSDALLAGTLDKAAASRAISALMSLPKRPRAAAAPRPVVAADLSEGMYRTADGSVYRVKKSRESGRLYAKSLDLLTGEFTYAAGAVYRLTAADRMTLEQAKFLGCEMGICIVCGATLTDPVSVAAGIGPICGNRV
jgi:hypothetical protein